MPPGARDTDSNRPGASISSVTTALLESSSRVVDPRPDLTCSWSPSVVMHQLYTEPGWHVRTSYLRLRLDRLVVGAVSRTACGRVPVGVSRTIRDRHTHELGFVEAERATSVLLSIVSIGGLVGAGRSCLRLAASLWWSDRSGCSASCSSSCWRPGQLWFAHLVDGTWKGAPRWLLVAFLTLVRRTGWKPRCSRADGLG